MRLYISCLKQLLTYAEFIRIHNLITNDEDHFPLFLFVHSSMHQRNTMDEVFTEDRFERIGRIGNSDFQTLKRRLMGKISFHIVNVHVHICIGKGIAIPLIKEELILSNTYLDTYNQLDHSSF